MHDSTRGHSQRPLPGGAIIDLEEARRNRGERLMGRRIEELMFVGGYGLYAALYKAASELFSGSKPAAVRVAGMTGSMPFREAQAAAPFPSRETP